MEVSEESIFTSIWLKISCMGFWFSGSGNVQMLISLLCHFREQQGDGITPVMT